MTYGASRLPVCPPVRQVWQAPPVTISRLTPAIRPPVSHNSAAVMQALSSSPHLVQVSESRGFESETKSQSSEIDEMEWSEVFILLI